MMNGAPPEAQCGRRAEERGACAWRFPVTSPATLQVADTLPRRVSLHRADAKQG